MNKLTKPVTKPVTKPIMKPTPKFASEGQEPAVSLTPISPGRVESVNGLRHCGLDQPTARAKESD